MARTKPYTKVGIRRVKCARCPRKARFQWNICSLGKTFHPLCNECDVEMQRVVLQFFDYPEWRITEIINRYRQRIKE